ncbi:MAG: flippase-like domain-containing protein, partial [Deltaproteobacteria bacterium]
MTVLLEILAAGIAALLVIRFAQEPWRGRLLNAVKFYVTIRAFWLLLSHPVAVDDGGTVVAWRLILEQLQGIDAGTFWTFVAIATGIKFVGMLSSMYRWMLVLRGQGVELPFRHIFGSFLIGRAIGTFLPSTAGLDGYTLYDAARFSGRTVEATAAKALEKVVGFSGIFLSYLVALPFGYWIFGENAKLIVALTLPIPLGVIAGLLLVLWYPAVLQWGLEHLPIPGKARLQGVVMRISNAVAAYRDKKQLVVVLLFLSFVVHFTTAAMYYFTALAIGAVGAQFWPIAFGSSVQILATVLSPFTIAGEGIREAAQYALLGNLIGPAAAIVSAALGFWAAEAPTMLGFLFWWLRGKDYRPAYCLVNGEQVDYESAARAALELETAAERRAREAAPLTLDPLPLRARRSGGFGLGAGLVSGLLLGIAEACVIAQGGFGEEAQVLWFGPLAYAVVLGGLGLLGGLALSVLPMDGDETRGWTPSLVVIGVLVPFALAITLFRLRRDVFLEQMPPLPVLAAVLGAAGVFALVVLFLGRRVFASRAGAFVRPIPALVLVAAVTAVGAVAARTAVPAAEQPPAPPPAPAELAERPNLILIMVDTLRADHLSC